MFISLSKTIAKVGGFRLGVGLRITKNNILWVSIILMFVYMIQLTWYMMVLCGWIMYAMFYGIIWCVKKIVKTISSKRQYSFSDTAESSSNNIENNDD
ncbi:MAG: hypothetical protein J6V71_00455 [Clostridia bacterium]|nr:hypothetical protein [Clostridia bacterium]